MLAQLDSNIGKILQALEETGQADNTLVVIASDNGGTNRQLDNNWPLYGEKSQFFEGGIRTPMMIRWQNKIEARGVIDDVVSIIDLMPTLILAAGGEVPAGIDGRDLIARIRHGTPLSGKPLFWENQFLGAFQFSVLSADGRWRLTSQRELGAREDDEIQYETVPILNDLQADPTGTDNFINEYPQQADSLLEQYETWFQEAHLLNLDYERESARQWKISGDDFQRTPGEGAFTVAIPLQNIESSTDDEDITIAQQRGVWSLDYNKTTGRLLTSFGELKLAGFIAPSTECQSLIITAVFNKRKNHWSETDSQIIGSFYINGTQVDSTTMGGILQSEEYTAEPTYITSADTQRPLFYNFYIRSQDYHTVNGLHQRICPEEAAQ